MTGPGVRPPGESGVEADTLVDDDLKVLDDEIEVLDDEIEVLDDQIVVDPDPEPDGLGVDADRPGGGPDAGLPAVDPRMQRRWIDRRRAEGRRRLRVLLGVAVFAFVAVLAWAVAHSSLFGMETLEVHGTRQLDPAAVRAAAHIDGGASLLFLDDDAIARRVERLPAVARATVRTELPGTVVIDVVERAPVAWADAPPPDRYALLDAGGLVFAREADQPAGLLRLGGASAGAVGSRVPHAEALGRIERLPIALRLMTDRADLSADGAVVLMLRAGQRADRVVLGDGSAPARKGAVALAILQDLEARGEHRREVDVRVPAAPLVR
jgi:cell division protein FtsQ